jgi:FkbM family methyltransferase
MKLINSLKKFPKKLYMRIWNSLNSYPNVHLGSESLVLKNIPFSKNKVYIRPSRSDISRIYEYINGIYFKNSFLHESVTNVQPKILLDIGANIGLSSLSLLSEFKSIKKIIGIEAEISNWEVLKRNYELWSKKFPEIEFVPVHGIASSSNTNHFSKSSLFDDGTLDFSASGTFMFQPFNKSKDNDNAVEEKVILINDLITSDLSNEKIICKIDIEGGEEFLFDGNTEWRDSVSFLTIEVHDMFNKKLINSSRGLINIIHKYDFAIVPDNDILHCYSRKINSITTN